MSGIHIIPDGGFQTGEGLPENRSWGDLFKSYALTSHPNTVIHGMVGTTIAGANESNGSIIYNTEGDPTL